MAEWPQEHRQTALQILGLKRQALKDLLEYLQHAGVYSQPDVPANTVRNNNVTIVPVERLTDEQLDLYLALARKGQALPPMTD